jgi:CubicO group peptidase (beta-lactamase class C family)
MTDVASDDPYADYTVADMYAFLNGYTLTRDPGAKYEYSNYGIGLLGQLLADRASTSYPALVRASVFAPLGMNDTSFLMPGGVDPAALAVGHDLAGSPAATWHFQSVAPAGGAASNVDDMLKYLGCNMGQGPLARACLFAQRPRADGDSRHKIGLVWNINSTTGIVSHGGDTQGFHAFIAVSRDHQTGVVALGNGPAVADIAAHVLAPEYPIGECPSSVAPSKTDPTSYAGVYCNRIGGLTFTVDITANSDRLLIALLPQPGAEVPRIAPDTYYGAKYDARFRFVRDDTRIVGLWLMQQGQRIPALRLDAAGKPVVAQLSDPFPVAIPLDATDLQQYVGTYNAMGIGVFTVTLRGSALFVQLTGQPGVQVYASAKDQFFYKIVDAQITFNRDSSGAVTSLTLHQNGQEIRATRAP